MADDVSAAFARACRERDLGVADHLLRALEIMACRGDDPTQIERAYLQIPQAKPDRRETSRSDRHHRSD
ncbi:MAG: hypothetical protein HYR63_03775 [Proteobacteria bacterium]|nr:hypothetical protein [Pseudomonadota bacterium]MBI3498578.1 hypothetical protein [Pseudomonadota bacterium]